MSVGDSTTRALDEHTPGIHLPRQFVFVCSVCSVIAFGVALRTGHRNDTSKYVAAHLGTRASK